MRSNLSPKLVWCLAALASTSAHAVTTGPTLPFNQGLQTIYDNFAGPTGTVLLGAVIIWGLIKWSGSERGVSGLLIAAKSAISLAIISTLFATLAALGIAAAGV